MLIFLSQTGQGDSLSLGVCYQSQIYRIWFLTNKKTPTGHRFWGVNVKEQCVQFLHNFVLLSRMGQL